MKKIVLFFALLATPAAAESSMGEIINNTGIIMQGPTYPGRIFSIDPNPTITFNAGKTYVVIKPDGTIEFGKDYEPDVAARAFWEAIGRNHPPACSTPGEAR